MQYRQCQLVQPTTTGRYVTVTYIQSDKAKKGKSVKLKGFEGEWIVDEIYGSMEDPHKKPRADLPSLKKKKGKK